MPTMNDTDAFLRKIRENPDDDAPRLVFADYLDEQAQSSSGKDAKEQVKWAALIRAQIAEERETVADVSLWNKWAGVDHSDDCKAAKQILPKGCRNLTQDWATRGFYDALEVNLTKLVQQSRVLLESTAPVRSFTLNFNDQHWEKIAENPVLGLIRELDLSNNDFINEEDFRAICNDSQLRQLTELDITTWENEDSDHYLETLKECENFPNLRRLYITFDEPIDCRELLQSPVCEKLEVFNIDNESIQCAEFQSQASLAKTLTTLWIDDSDGVPSKKPKWGQFENLQQLDLWVNQQKNWVTPFLKSQNLQSIKHLELRGDYLPTDILSHFEEGDEELTLELENLSQVQLKAILGSPTMARVKGLVVECEIIGFALEILSKNEAITNLRSLKLRSNQGLKKPNPFFKTLYSSSVFANLLHFETNCSYPVTNLKQLAESEVGQSLRAIICGSPNKAAKWQEIMRDTKNFPNLVHFSFWVLDFDDNLLAKGRKKLKLT